MSIVTISRGSFSHGSRVAQRLAERLNYECISREILLDASEKFNVPEIKLIRAFEDAPSFFDRFTNGRAMYVSFIRAALLERICKDNVVYHGFAGHALLMDLPQVLKVRVIAARDARIKLLMHKENVSWDRADEMLTKLDNTRRKWTEHLYGQNPNDPGLYDLVINISRVSEEEGAAIIERALEPLRFATTPESQALLHDTYLGAQVEACLIQEYPKIKVSSKDGVVFVAVYKSWLQNVETAATMSRIRELAESVEGVASVEIGVVP